MDDAEIPAPPETVAEDSVPDRVLRATDRMLAAGTPFTAISMRRVAAAAGIARSTVYRHFPQKNLVLIRLVDAETEDRFAPVERWWNRLDAGDGAAMTDALAALIEFRRERGHLLAALAEVAAYDAVVAEYYAMRTARLSECVLDGLRRARAAGRVPARAVDPAVAVILAALVERTIDLYVSLGPAVERRRIATALSRAVAVVAAGM